MKKALRILGIILWAVGMIWIIYVMGAVFSRTEGFTTLAGLIGPLAFHFISMLLGGFCFIPSAQKSAKEIQAPAAQ